MHTELVPNLTHSEKQSSLIEKLSEHLIHTELAPKYIKKRI